MEYPDLEGTQSGSLSPTPTSAEDPKNPTLFLRHYPGFQVETSLYGLLPIRLFISALLSLISVVPLINEL